MSLLAQLKATQIQGPQTAAAPLAAPSAPVSQLPPQPNPYQQPPQAMPQQPGFNPYAGVSTAQGKHRPKLPLGTHVLKVIQCRDGNFPREIGGNFFFAADLLIVESTNPEVVPNQEASWLTSMGKFPQYFLSDVKDFIIAASGLPKEMITDDTPREATAQNNPLANRLLIAEVTATNKKNKEGEMIPNILFKAVPATAPAQTA